MINQLLAIANGKKEMKRDTFLFQEGEQATYIYFLHSGKVRISKGTPDGREITFRICQVDDFICEVPLFCATATRNVHAKVIEDGMVSIIKKNDLEELLCNQPDFNKEFMRNLGIQQQKSQSKFRDLILHGKKGALYSTLIRMCNSYGINHGDEILIDLQITNQELANFCGMSREVVNRLLNELKRNGVITMEKSYITIKDVQYLRSEIHCDDCPIEICNMN